MCLHFRSRSCWNMSDASGGVPLFFVSTISVAGKDQTLQPPEVGQLQIGRKLITQACPRLHMLRGFKDVKSKVQRRLMLLTLGIQRPTCMVAHETASAFWYYVLMILDGVHAQSFADNRFSTIYNAVLVFYMMLLWLSRRVGENVELSVVATWEALSNGYVLSKLAAERFVHRAFGKGLKGAIFRPGMLWGSSKTGTPKTVCGVCRHEWGHVLFKWGWACLSCTANQAGML